MQRRSFLKLVAAVASGTIVKIPKSGELQHWKLGNFGQFIWTGQNPRRLCYKGLVPDNLWEDFKLGRNFEDRTDWRAVVTEIDDLSKLTALIKKENWVRV